VILETEGHTADSNYKVVLTTDQLSDLLNTTTVKNLELQGAVGNVSFSREALKTIQTDQGDVTFTVKKLTTEESAALNSSNTVYEFSVATEQNPDAAVSGPVTVTVPYEITEPENQSGITVNHIKDDGTTEVLPAVYDAEAKTISFVTDSFSYFEIVVPNNSTNPGGTTDDPSNPGGTSGDPSNPGETSGSGQNSGQNQTGLNGSGTNGTASGKQSGAVTGKAPSGTAAAKRANTLQVKAKTVKVKYAKLLLKKQKIPAKKVFKVTGAQGKVIYKIVKKDKKAGNKIKLSKAGKLTVKKGLKKGTYKIKVQVTAAGSQQYFAGSKTVTLKVKIK